MRPAHTIELVPWRGTSVGERIALEMTSMALWPLEDDARMTVLINLLAVQIDRIVRRRSDRRADRSAADAAADDAGNMKPHVNTLFDEHDYQQLKLLVKLNKTRAR